MASNRRGLLIALVLLAGCTKPEAYYDVMREKRATWREVTAILMDVEDEKTLGAAKAKLDARQEEFEARARKAQALPNPPPPEVLERMRDERTSMQQAFDDLQYQIRRVQNLKLKGGEAFFKHFESQEGPLSGIKP